MIPMNGSSFGRAGGLLPPVPRRHREHHHLGHRPRVDPKPPRRLAIGSTPQSAPHSGPVRRAPRPSSPAPCQLTAKGYLLPDFYSGATGQSGRFTEGFCLRRLHRSVRAVLPGMIARQSGDIIVTSSIAGHQALRWEPVYSATKHAVQSFVHGVRRQIAPHKIRIGAIAPGTVLNELWGVTDPTEIDRRAELREGLRSEDVAEACLWMLTRPPNVTIRDLVMLPQNQDI